MSFWLRFNFDVGGDLCLWVDDGRPQCGVPRFSGAIRVNKAIRVPCCAERYEWEVRGSLCRVWYVWVGVCVGGVDIYVLWVFLVKIEVDDRRCFTCELGNGCVEFGEDVISVK